MVRTLRPARPVSDPWTSSSASWPAGACMTEQQARLSSPLLEQHAYALLWQHQKTLAHKKHRQHVWLRGCSNNTRHGSWSWSRVLLWVATAAHRLCVPRPSPHHLCHHLLWTLLHHVLHLHVQRHTTRVMCVCYYHMPPHASQQQLQDEVMRSAVAPQLHCKCIRCCNSCRCQRNKHSPNVPRWQ